MLNLYCTTMEYAYGDEGEKKSHNFIKKRKDIGLTLLWALVVLKKKPL